MAEKTIYCAQGFWRRMGKLCGGQVHHFSTEERAVAGGDALFTGAHGVAVFSVTGYPDIDLWDDPVMIVALGDVPAIEEDAWVEAA